MKEVINKISCANRTIIRKLDSMPSFRSASDLTCKRGYILGYLIDHKNQKIYQKDLEKVFNVRRSSMSEILTTMENNKLIERIPSNDDARLKEIKILEKGMKMNALVKNEIMQVENEIDNLLSSSEKEMLVNILEKIINKLNMEGEKNND